MHDWDTSTYAYYNDGRDLNTFGGLQFHAYHNDSNFFIDDICLQELDNGSGGPVIPIVLGN